MKIHTKFYTFVFNFNQVEIHGFDEVTQTVTMEELYNNNWDFSWNGFHFRVWCDGYTAVLSQQRYTQIGWCHTQSFPIDAPTSIG